MSATGLIVAAKVAAKTCVVLIGSSSSGLLKLEFTISIELSTPPSVDNACGGTIGGNAGDCGSEICSSGGCCAGACGTFISFPSTTPWDTRTALEPVDCGRESSECRFNAVVGTGGGVLRPGGDRQGSPGWPPAELLRALRHSECGAPEGGLGHGQGSGTGIRTGVGASAGSEA